MAASYVAMLLFSYKTFLKSDVFWSDTECQGFRDAADTKLILPSRRLSQELLKQQQLSEEGRSCQSSARAQDQACWATSKELSQLVN